MWAETILFILFSPGLLLPVIGKRVRLALVASYAFLFAVALTYKDRIPLLNQLDDSKEAFENNTSIVWKVIQWIVFIIFIVACILAILSGDIFGMFFGSQGLMGIVGKPNN